MQRKQATASALTALCRRLTAERGLHGFTVEEVCSEVGVSRRTFFNYFASKEDAVLGIDELDGSRLAEKWQSRTSRGWSAVVDDLVELAVDYSRTTGVSAENHSELMRILEREPRLLARFIGLGREREIELLSLVAESEGVSPDDPRARAAVNVVTTVMRSTADRLSDPRVAADFAAALRDSLAALSAVLATTPGKADL